MRKAAKKKTEDKKRADAEPTVTYDEPFASIYEVGTRLKAVAKSLQRQIKRAGGVGLTVTNLERIEKRLQKRCGCDD